MNRIKLVISVLFIAFVLQASCASRYRLDFLMDTGHGTMKAKINGTQVVLEAKLNEPYAEKVISSGSGAVLLVSTETRGLKAGLSQSQYFGFDELIRSELYLEFDYPFKKDSIDLSEHAMVQMLGHYSWTPEARIFLPESGYCLIDSVTSDFLYATAKGSFVNNGEKQLSIEGQFRARIKN
jgi:hypothetical protein